MDANLSGYAKHLGMLGKREKKPKDFVQGHTFVYTSIGIKTSLIPT